jgi:glycogen debranching enzyme
MRTLSPSAPSYCGRYSGDVLHRDSVYHQGTVWPWLLGPFITSYVRAYGDSPAVRKTARRFLSGLEDHLLEAGLGSISEVADGDAPYHPGGCPWQAWSVAEPLRSLLEDILQPERGDSLSRSESRMTTAQLQV